MLHTDTVIEREFAKTHNENSMLDNSTIHLISMCSPDTQHLSDNLFIHSNLIFSK